MEPDIVIRNGTVVDGTGAPPRLADVAVTGGVISAVGDLRVVVGPELDAAGAVVCPGFVDTHTHTDWVPFLPAEHESLTTANLLQGVTTEIPGNCGFSMFPAVPERLAELGARNERALGGAGRAFSSLDDYRAALEHASMPVNMAPLVGHGTLRAAAMGWDDRAPTSDELATMRRLADDAMAQGAFGLSTGLVYAPGMFASTDEIVEVSRVVARHGRRYASHMRNETDRVEEAVDETVRIGREAGVAVHVSHHKIGMPPNWGKSASTLRTIEACRAAGIDVTLDTYPYDAASTGLASLLPRWAQDAPDVQDRLRDEADRSRIAAALAGTSMHTTGTPRGHWERVRIARFPERRAYEGRTIAEIADERGSSDVDVVLDLLTIDPFTMQIVRGMDPAEVATIISRPYAMVGSDGVPLPGQPHPRIAGSFATVLADNAADDTRLADAVRRMTSLPCSTFGIPHRGRVATGLVADLVVFDRATIAPGATYDDPLVAPVGVRHVLVAGCVAVRDGRDTGVRAGAVLSPA